MPFEHYITSGTKRLRCGYTTGSCAALAAKAAAQGMLSGAVPQTVTIQTPKGLPVTVEVLQARIAQGACTCAVQKDAGDDCDATDGALIVASVTQIPQGVVIDGGTGVGRVTQKGLDQPVGAAAINAAPRRMIAHALAEVAQTYGYAGGFAVIISVPGGAEIAQKTFNPQLGIMGGISILGTSGIVEPQSMQALVDSIGVEVRMAAAQGAKQIVLTPGNYGETFLLQYPKLAAVPRVKCSNFIGDTLDFAAVNGFAQVLLVGHIGKMVKLAGGIMNTHSRYADCRTELFAAHAALHGARAQIVRALMEAATADACIAILQEEDLCAAVLQSLTAAAQVHLERRAAGVFAVGIVMFSNAYGLLTASDGARNFLKKFE